MIRCCLVVLLTLLALGTYAQKNYFIDGYHGGIYGHYPVWYTDFMTQQLAGNPAWKINLEIEPETWDAVKWREPEAYAVLRELLANQSDGGRIEYVNPAYGQSYLYTGSGESMVRQFSYGIKKLKEHFPNLVFTTYSSEEPCFTSALPQVLVSFGYKYASLKNPNTCWGGYTRAFGGELVQWQGPDGTQLLTVPRYRSEALAPNSTWQTTAWNNGRSYIQSALTAGIKNPIGMCLQDAGWRNGPWLRNNAQYETWRNYIGHIADRQQAVVWPFSQEDVQVSLVWGAQVLQRIAQQVRAAENKLAAAEKYAAISTLTQHTTWPQKALDTAWQSLLLAQHHDCWIVPYNGRKGDTWIDKVKNWTDVTLHVSDSILLQNRTPGKYVRVLNTTALPREEWVAMPVTPGKLVKLTDSKGKQTIVHAQANGSVLFKAKAPPMGYAAYRVEEVPGRAATKAQSNVYTIETGDYRLTVDPANGGVITSLIAKKMGNKEMVDKKHARGFNELRGYFYNDSAWRSSMDTAAAIWVTKTGKEKVSMEIKGHIAGHPFTQTITLTNGQRRINMQVHIDWQGNPGIGAWSQATGYTAEEPRKAFYNDSCKLQVLFPVNIQHQHVSKDAPYDVTESRLPNTFFSSWDSIKNNVVLHWAGVSDSAANTGMALFTDHTTSYVHGEGYPLGLTLQYAGRALWGRNYDITGATDVSYAIVPHKGTWDTGGISEEETRWNESLLLAPANTPGDYSLLSLQDTRWQVPAMMMDGNDLLVRLYNAAGDDREHQLILNGSSTQVDLEQLNGQLLKVLPTQKIAAGKTAVRLAMPRFGIRTIRFKNVIIHQ